MNIFQRPTLAVWAGLLLLVAGDTACTQEGASFLSAADALEPVHGPAVAPTGPFSIDEISFEVDGSSRPRPLLLASGLERGMQADTIAELEDVLLRARQDLINRRVFDKITVEWSVVDEPEAPGAPTAVEAVFYVDDGWTLLPIPFYRYNSNSGHNPLVVLYWDNILGTLTDFGVSAGYYSRNWTTPFGWDVRLDWRRVRMLGRQWNFSFDQEFETFEQASPDGEIDFAYSGYSTRFGVSTSFRLNEWLRYAISPDIVLDYGYETLVNETSQSLPAERAAAGFGHGLRTGGVDWVNNLRRGWSASLSNGISYDPEQRDWQADLRASYARHWLPRPRVSPGLRARVSHHFDGDKLSQGGIIRGVANNRVFGATVAAVNAQVSTLAIDWTQVIDIQVVPFVDVAVARKQGQSLDTDDLSVGFGADVVLFPDFMRGFQGRLSFGWDARELIVGRPSQLVLEFSITETLQL